MYWERTALNEIVVRNCSEVDPELGGRKNFLILFVEKLLFFDGLLAQLVERCTGIAEVMGSNPVQA